MRKQFYNKSIALIFIVLSNILFAQENVSGITMEIYDNISGNSYSSDLFSAVNYPDSPDETSILSLFEIPSNSKDSYGARVSGFITPPETGLYYFWIAADDSALLEISTDDNPENSETIAYVSWWTSPQEWNKYTNQKSVGIYLTKDSHYYIEANMKEGGGGDNLAVGWRKPSDGDNTEPTEVVPGSVLSPRNTVFSNDNQSGSLWNTNGSTLYYNEGSMGLGVQDTHGYKLAVDGNIRTREIRVDQDTWPDYVFKKDYGLPTLEEVEKHINEKGHLINIPSAKDVKANGIEVGEMNKLLLEKIEELTLYVIELKKENSSQQKEIEVLKNNKHQSIQSSNH